MAASQACGVVAQMDADCAGAGFAGTDAEIEIGAATPNHQILAVRSLRRKMATISKYYRYICPGVAAMEASSFPRSYGRGQDEAIKGHSRDSACGRRQWGLV